MDAPDSVLARIKKLLNLATHRNTPAAEAASAVDAANRLMEEWNLAASDVENHASEDGRREDARVRGGFYSWQRDLWESVARLNFCLYFTQQVWVREKWSTKRTESWSGERVRVEYEGKYVRHHRLVGRVINVAVTQHTARYLEGVIERLVCERTQGARSEAHSNWAVSYRKGVAATVMERLETRRRERADKELRGQREAADRAASGHSTATALSIATVEQREHDANQDFLHGEGWSAQVAASRARSAELRRLAIEERTQWAAAHPEEAAEQERRQREAYEKTSRRYRFSAGPRDNTDYGAFRAGRDAGSSISLDAQVDAGAQGARRIARG